jgi:predicted GH43/DUF377 family glycosyl hydrolase
MPTVIYDEGMYRMWFVGDGYVPDRAYSFGYAVSENGVDWFQYAKNPVLTQGSNFDDRYMWGGTVIRDGNLYRLYFGGYSSLTQKWSVGMATSTDRIHWSKLASPVLTGGGTGSWDVNGVSQPCVVKESEGQYKMWYGGSTNQSTTAIGFATSTDGVVWEKYSGNPILVPSSNLPWESYLLSDPRVVKVGSTYHMFYFGANNSSLYQIGYASSENGTQWERYSGNPVIRVGESGSWDDYTLSAHWVMWKDSSFMVWYAGRTSEGIFQLGYATSQLTTSTVSPKREFPNEFSLHPNYPNPFNPSTTIAFDVPKKAMIQLRIFDMLGAEISTLVNEEKNPGSYSVTWDASGRSSGTYWFRLTSNGVTVTQKSLLLK